VLKPKLYHLVTVVKGALPNVTLRVLQAEGELRDYAIARSGFSIYAYPDPADPRVVAIDTVTSDVIVTDKAQVAPYERLYERLREAALSPEESAKLLTEAADALPDH
jgi:hypothetical protein